MTSDRGQDEELAAYKAALPADFFGDESATEARKKEERRRGRTPAERVQAKKRPLQRTEHIGIRTTPDVRARINALMERLDLATATEVIERALLDLESSLLKRKGA